MDKVNRLGWAATIGFSSHGLRFGVRVDPAEALPEVLERLPPGFRRSANPLVRRLYSLKVGGAVRQGVRKYHLLFDGPTRIVRTHELEEALDVLETEIAHHVAKFAPRRVFIHAGVAGWQGRAIVLPGRTHAGKSTLVAALVRAGATYYSDEYAVLDSEGMVHPYSRLLSLRGPNASRPVRCTAAELGGKTGARPLPVGLIASAVYRPDATWRPRKISTGQACLELFANAVPARRRAAQVLGTCRGTALSACAVKGVRGDADAAAAALLELCARLPAP